MKNRLASPIRFLAPVIVSVASFGLYFSTVAPGMLKGDSGEFQWAMASLNVPHATGYPLFTLLGYVWQQLPLDGPVAWRLNLLSAIYGAAAVGMVYLTSRRLTGRDSAALVAAVIFALTPVFWFNASILEVYTLNAFFLALIIYLVLVWSDHPSGRSAIYFAFFVLGLALAHHRMIILAIPGILIFVLLTHRRFLLSLRHLVGLGLVLLPGLALYAYVPIRLLPTGATLNYAIFDIILGQEFSASLFREYHFAQVLWQIPVDNFHASLVLALVGAITLFRQRRNLAILLILIYLADLAFALAYWVPDVDVFLTPSFVVIALWIAAGAAWVIGWVTDHITARYARLAPAATEIVLILLAFFGLSSYSGVRAEVAAEAGNSETRARALLASGLPAGALLELDWETATAVRFVQTTELQRRDLEARLIKVDEKEEYNWVFQNVDSGRPVFLERDVNWTRSPAGYFLKSAPVDLAQVVRGQVGESSMSDKIDDKVELAALRNNNEALVLYWLIHQPLDRDLATFVHFFDADGKPLGQQDHAPCCQAVYGYRTTEWQVGREIADNFAPTPAGASYLQVGMYGLTNGDIDSYGRTLTIQLAPSFIPASAQPAGIEFANKIVARAYEITDDGKDVRLRVYWEAQGKMLRDYGVFVRLVNSSGEVVERAQHEPLDGLYPTGEWKDGQIVRDTLTVAREASAAALEFGLIDSAAQQPVARADGTGDYVTIGLK